MPAIGHLLAASSYLAKVNCSLRSGAAGGTKTRGIYANYSQQVSFKTIRSRATKREI